MVVQSCFHSGTAFDICCTIAETISVTFSKYSNQHEALIYPFRPTRD